MAWKYSEGILLFKDKADGLNLLHDKTKECEEVLPYSGINFLDSVTPILQFLDSDLPIPWFWSSNSVTLILQFVNVILQIHDSDPQMPWLWSSTPWFWSANSLTLILQYCDSDPPSLWLWSCNSMTLIICQVEKFVAKVKAEKERARKALEMEARREQGAVWLNFYFNCSLFHFLFDPFLRKTDKQRNKKYKQRSNKQTNATIKLMPQTKKENQTKQKKHKKSNTN